MSANDAATLLIGNMAAEQLNTAPDVVRDLGGYFLDGMEDKYYEPTPYELNELYNLEYRGKLLPSATKLGHGLIMAHPNSD